METPWPSIEADLDLAQSEQRWPALVRVLFILSSASLCWAALLAFLYLLLF